MAAALPVVELRYSDLWLSLQLPKAEPAEPQTVRDAVASIPRKLLDRFRPASKRAEQTRELKVIDHVSGSILPGRMTLIIGHPGSGKSSFLKALAGQISNPSLLHGEVRYNGLTRAELLASGVHLSQLAQYVGQLDEHSPFLTVRETLRFAARNALAGIDEAAVEARVLEMLALLRLQDCADTVVGNALMRGISGGEMKRVTVGEGLLSNARFIALDEISTGLDATVTLQIVKALQARCQSGVGVVVALLQATPETVALFDDVIALREGAVIYHGPRIALPGYLRGLGFLPPDNPDLNLGATAASPCLTSASEVTPAPQVPQTTEGTAAQLNTGIARTTSDAASAAEGLEDEDDLADWVAEWVTYPARRHRKDLLRTQRRSGGDGTVLSSGAPIILEPPTTTEALVAAWRASELHATLVAPATSRSDGVDLSLSSLARAQFGRAYVHSPLQHLWLLLNRQVLLNRRNRLFIAFRLANALIMGLIISAMYFQTSVANGLNLYGLFLNTVMFLSFANLSEMSPTLALRQIAYRQVAKGNYPAWTFPLAIFIAQLPVAAIESCIFALWLYFMGGLTLEVGRFFFYLLVAFLSDVFAANLFRCFSLGFPTLEASQTGPMPIIALLIVFAGFLVLPSKMGWMQFIYHLDPYSYAIRSLAQNEFSAERYAVLIKGGLTLGESYLSFFDMPTDLSYKWGGVGFLLGVIFILLAVNIIVFTFVHFDNNIGSARHLEDDSAPSESVFRAPVASSIPPTLTHVAVDLPAAAVTLAAHEGGQHHADSIAAISVAAAASALPFEPASVAFRDMSYTVKLPGGGGDRILLHRVSGYALPGRMLALMGASGAGKTTLLDVLAGRKNSGTMTGEMFLRGHPKDSKTFNRLAAYCEQQDIHASLTTVREALEFSARLRLATSVSPAQRASFVDEVMRLLELDTIASRLVGIPGATDALAPGERKRLTIGVELCANTPVIFLDEPTSGLDARAAAVVVRTLRNVASTGRTIICTVHQPSHEIFAQFDDLLLLQRGGWLVYSGRLGHDATSLVHYLEALPGVQPLPTNQNVATWMLDVLSASHAPGATPMGEPATVSPDATPAPKQDAVIDAAVGIVSSSSAPPQPAASVVAVDKIETRISGRRRGAARGAVLSGEEFQRHFYVSKTWMSRSRPALELASAPPLLEATAAVVSAAATPSALVQFAVLAHRELNSARRNVSFNLGRIASLAVLNLLFGTIYYKIADKATDVAGLQSLVAGIYMVSVFAGMINLNLVLAGQIKARPVFYRETSALVYSPWPYVWAVISAELPWLAVAIVIGPTFSYFMMGLSTDAGVFWTNYLAVFIMAFAYGLLGMAAANALPTFEVAQALVSSLAAILMLYGGIFSKVSNMPAGSRWVNTIDPVGYLLRVVLPLHIHCEGGKAAGCPSILYPTPSGVIPVDRSVLMNTLYEVFFDQIWSNMGWLALFVPCFFAANALALRFVRHIVR